MKSKIICLLAAFCCLGYICNGQLLKKLKQKTDKVLDQKKSESVGSSDVAGYKTTASPAQKTNEPTVAAAPPSNGTVVFNLGADENLLYDESKILTKNNKLVYSFVVQNKKQEYFLIEDGNRSGPFKAAPIKSLSEQSDDGSSGSYDYEVSLGDKKDPVAIQHSKTIDGKLFIVFNGKNFGPYDFVSKMIVSTDKKQFFALVTVGSESPMMAKMGMGYSFMVNEAALKRNVGDGGMLMPVKFSASTGFKHCMATVMNQKTQKIITVTSANKQEEGNLTDIYAGGDEIKSFVNDNGDIISIPAQSPTQVLVNGKEAASFSVPIKSMDRLFLTPDISKSVYYEKGKIYKADGTEESLGGVLFPKVVTVGNETAVYYFKLYKNESGAKHIYLCKKVI